MTCPAMLPFLWPRQCLSLQLVSVLSQAFLLLQRLSSHVLSLWNLPSPPGRRQGFLLYLPHAWPVRSLQQLLCCFPVCVYGDSLT